MNILIPFVSAILFRLGGSDAPAPLEISAFGSHYKIKFNMKLFRWFMGVPIAILAWKGWLALALAAVTYFVATNVFGYGEKTPVLKSLPKWLRFTVSGIAFGLASAPILHWLCIAQAIIGGVAFYIIFLIDEKKLLINPWIELLRGFCGTIVYL